MSSFRTSPVLARWAILVAEALLNAEDVLRDYAIETEQDAASRSQLLARSGPSKHRLGIKWCPYQLIRFSG